MVTFHKKNMKMFADLYLKTKYCLISVQRFALPQ